MGRIIQQKYIIVLYEIQLCVNLYNLVYNSLPNHVRLLRMTRYNRFHFHVPRKSFAIHTLKE